jgi:prolyl oligopeptidase
MFYFALAKHGLYLNITDWLKQENKMKNRNQSLIIGGLLLAFLSTACEKQEARLDYPASDKYPIETTYHDSINVVENFRWMEDIENPVVQKWIEDQDSLTRAYLQAIPARDTFLNRVTEVWNYEKFSIPVRKGDYYFYSYNTGMQNQSVYYRSKGLDGEPEVVLDPNTLSEDGTVSAQQFRVNKNGKIAAYTVSVGGSDQMDIRVRNLDTGKDYDETLKWAKFTSIAWHPKGHGFFYNRYPDPATVAKEDVHKNMKVYFHRVNTPQSADQLIYEDPANPELGYAASVSEDEKYLVIYVWNGTSPKNGLMARSLNRSGKFSEIVPVGVANFEYVVNKGRDFYLKTDQDAPRGKIVHFDLKTKAMKDVVAEQKNVLDSYLAVNNEFVLVYMEDVKHQLYRFSMQGEMLGKIELPGIGSVWGLEGKLNEDYFFMGFSGFSNPLTVYTYDYKDNKLSVYKQAKVAYNIDDFEAVQEFATSKDGTKVPMFIVKRKDQKLDGSAPAILYGYGGFNISLTPSFSASRLAWVEQGALYVIANLRGGNEYGEEWHRAGMLHNKQNVFDDFIACAEHLIEKKYTSREKLAINGGSNGGLLTAAVMLQRPDLFGGVLIQVPVLDMLRYHKFTIGKYWIPEYGSADNSIEELNTLLAYSPLHNIKAGVDYPPMMIMTADRDDRVDPAHARKFTAEMQTTYTGSSPVLLRVELKAGHGHGKPTSKRIEEIADVYAFLAKNLNMTIK